MNEDGHTSNIRDKILTINVKPGWKSGTKITFPNEGDQGPNNIPGNFWEFDVSNERDLIALLNIFALLFNGLVFHVCLSQRDDRRHVHMGPIWGKIEMLDSA